MGKKGNKSGGRDKPDLLSKADYYEQLAPLELELLSVARWLQHTGKRLVVVVEGRDTAGKGGVIAAIADTLNPRQCHVVALGMVRRVVGHRGAVSSLRVCHCRLTL